ncbi:hypothetical protein [Adhaeribacter terreus]|uniref:Tat (Twin-arginine translocation) pathway signal sequence n=1 Tax=Adhaeribacter terreus TaxID=529703 RepID=A0ABW0EF74_9BACT
MGIGRRQFLKLTSLALVGISIDPFQSVITTDDVYINKKLGILFHKPKSWGFIKVADFGKLKDSQILNEGWEEIKELVHEEIGEPICIATKYYHDSPDNKGIFSPTITLNITPKEELEDLGYESFEELLKLSKEGVSQILKDFKVLKEYEPYYLSGSKFYEYDAQYLFEHIDIDKPLLVELKVLKAEHNGFYYDFNCHQSSEQNQVAIREFDEFKKSIKLI